MSLSLNELLNIQVVTASRHAEDMDSAAAVMTVITAEQIRQSGANNLYHLLEQVTSFYMAGSHFFPQNLASIRGDLLTHADNHVLILLNGKPLRESYSGGINFAIYNAFPVQALSRIEVIRGPGSVLYGSNAFSGVINLVTDPVNVNRVQLSADQQGFKSGALVLSGKQEQLNLNLAASLNSNDGWNFSSVDNNGVKRSIDYGQQNAGWFSSLNTKDWQLEVMSLSSQQDFFGASTNWSGGVPPDQREVDSERHHAAFSHQWHQSDQMWLGSAMSVARMDFSHYNYDAFSTERFLELNQHWQPSHTWAWQFGGALWWQRFGTDAGLSAGPVPLTRNRKETAFVQADWNINDHWQGTLGSQYNHRQQGGNEWVPRFAIIWQKDSRWTLKLLQAKAYRDPYGVETDFDLVLRDSNGQVTGGLRGNKQLASETIRTTDLQLLYQAKAERYSITLFRSDANDLITRQRAADNIIDFVNAGEMQLQGIELECTQQRYAPFTLEASLTHQKNRVNETDGYTTAPEWLMKSAVNYQLGNGWGNIHVATHYTGEAGDIVVRNPNRRQVNPTADAYWLINVAWQLPLPEFHDSEIETSVYNVLDEDIYQAEFVGQTINTIPVRAGRLLTLRFAMPIP